MPLEVIGAGFGRTGTASLQAALDILYRPENKKCYHFGSICNRPRHADFWIKVLSGELTPKASDWEELFGEEDFAATMDHPAADYYQELMEAYPRAKVILSNHPGGRDKWYKSKLGHQLLSDAMSRMPLRPLARLLMPILARTFPDGDRDYKSPAIGHVSFDNLVKLVEVTERNIWGPRGVHDADNALGIYDKRYAAVRQNVPKDILLEYDVSMGWEPLCEFLGKPVPDEPFPRADGHSTAGIKKLVGQMEMVAWGIHGLALASAAALVYNFLL